VWQSDGFPCYMIEEILAWKIRWTWSMGGLKFIRRSYKHAKERDFERICLLTTYPCVGQRLLGVTLNIQKLYFLAHCTRACFVWFWELLVFSTPLTVFFNGGTLCSLQPSLLSNGYRGLFTRV
jgi:hypothetical protein